MTSKSYAFGGLFHRNINNYFFRQLVGSGVRVFRYTDILHAKTMLIDDDALCIGTVNLNGRSLQIDDELYIYFESKELVEEYEQIFNQDLEHCIELDYVKFRNQNLFSRAAESVVSFFSPFS